MRLEKYLARSLLTTTVVGSFVAIALLLGLQVLRLSDIIVKFDLNLVDIATMLGGLGLSFVPLVLPIAFLFALLMLFGQMATDKELVALLSLGVSPWKILRAPLFMGGLLVLVTTLAAAQLGPLGNQEFEKSIDSAFKRRVASALRSGTFSMGFLDLVIFVDSVDPATQKLERVFVFDETNFEEKVAISARQGQWIQSPETGTSTLKLSDGVLVSQNIERQTVKRVDFEDYRVHADFSRQTGVSKTSPPSLTLTQLFAKRAEMKSQPYSIDPRGFWVEIWRRFALGFLPILFVPLAFSLSLNNHRTARSQATFWGLLIIFSYWTMYFTSITFVLKGQHEILWTQEWPAVLSAWVPNFVVLGVGLVLYRHRTRPMG